jgi:hypothetical protein
MRIGRPHRAGASRTRGPYPKGRLRLDVREAELTIADATPMERAIWTIDLVLRRG